MEGKGSFFILLVIIAILTLTLAIAVGYLFIVGGNPQKTVTVTEAQTTKIPQEKELEKVALFTENDFFNLKSNGDQKISVLMVNAELSYFIKIKGYGGKTSEKITANLTKIKEIIGTYFQGLTLADVQQLDAKSKASEALTKQINDYLSLNEKQKYSFVYEIAFDKWNYQ